MTFAAVKEIDRGKRGGFFVGWLWFFGFFWFGWLVGFLALDHSRKSSGTGTLLFYHVHIYFNIHSDIERRVGGGSYMVSLK